MKLLAAAVGLGASVALLTVGGPGKSSELSVQPPPKAPIGPLTFTADAIGGGLLWGDEGTATILDLAWGIKDSGEIGFAYLKVLDPQGKVVEIDQVDHFRRVAITNEELSGSCLRIGPNPEDLVRIESVTFGIRSDGLLAPLAYNGVDKNGTAFSTSWLGSSLQGNCCTAVTHTRCVPFPTCTGDCPGPGNCACQGTGSCEIIMFPVCEGRCGDGCPGEVTEECTGTITNCHCQAS
jgi:hypothetical protein